MVRVFRTLLFALLPGAACAAISIGLSQLVLRSLGNIVRFVGSIAGMKEADIGTYALILDQLRDASLVSPWLPALLLCCGVNALLAILIHRGKIRKITISVGLCLLVLIPAALWFTQVNGVMLGDMLRLLIPLLQSGIL